VNADRLATAWARLYTRGLPPEVAERRRAELRSDLHEHASAAGRTPAQQREVLGRVLWGIPADLSWRRVATAPRERRLASGATMTLRKLSTPLFVVYALFQAWAAIGILGNLDGPAVPYVVALFAGAVLLGLGVRWRDEAPRRSTVLISVGALVPAVTLFWMAFIFGPIGIALAVLAVRTEPGRHEPVLAA
jgi:hypothetical protein